MTAKLIGICNKNIIDLHFLNLFNPMQLNPKHVIAIASLSNFKTLTRDSLCPPREKNRRYQHCDVS